MKLIKQVNFELKYNTYDSYPIIKYKLYLDKKHLIVFTIEEHFTYYIILHFEKSSYNTYLLKQV